jgi:hypothetical protein
VHEPEVKKERDQKEESARKRGRRDRDEENHSIWLSLLPLPN